MSTTTDPSRRQFLARSGAALMVGLTGHSPEAEEPVPLTTTDEWIQQRAAAAPLAMQFRGGSAEDCRAWQARFAAQLRSLLGAHRPPTEWKTNVQRVKEL